MLVEGGEIADGDDLPLLGPIALDGNNIFANTPLALNTETINGLAEMGLLSGYLPWVWLQFVAAPKTSPK